MRPSEYSPPPAAEMLVRQDDDQALRLLIAQRRLYSRAKRWLGLRWFGMLVIGLAAPVISVLLPQLAVVAGAVAGLWIFLGRTALVFAQSAATSKAAATQEQFDFYVFEMPASIERSAMPSLEEVFELAGPDTELQSTAAREKLLGWYPLHADDSGTVAIAISQRANASYSDRLLRTTALVWAWVAVGWVTILIVASAIMDISLATFMVGVFLPVLPAFLDVVEYVSGMRKAARSRGDLARSIERRITADGQGVDYSDLLVWQERLYDLRRTMPQVPDLIYRFKRPTNESAMTSAARELGSQTKNPSKP